MKKIRESLRLLFNLTVVGWNHQIFLPEYALLKLPTVTGDKQIFSFSQNGWLVDGFESGTKFSDVDLTEKEWADYDEKAKTTVGIYEIEHEFAREK